MDTISTRRALIGAMIAAPVLSAPALAGSSHSVSTVAWDAAIARLDAARAVKERAAIRMDAAFEAWDADVPAIETVNFSAFPFQDRNRVLRTIDLDAEWQRWLAGEGNLWGASDRQATIAKQRASYDSIRAYKKAEIDADLRHGRTASEDEWEKADAEVAEAERVLVEMPAPGLEQLLWKLDHLFGEEARHAERYTASYCPTYVDPVMADARRLLSGEVA